MKNKTTSQDGFISIIGIILGIVALLILLHFLNINLTDVLSSNLAKQIFGYIWYLMKIVWNDVLLIIAFVKSMVASLN